MQRSSTSIDYTTYPRIPNHALRMLWIVDYYDGPLSGMLVYDGNLCWYECANFSVDDERRRYVVRGLTEEQIADEEKWNALFVEHVGDHWLVHEDGRPGVVKPLDEHSKFYEPYSKREPRDYSTQPILGWFED